jgi:hypothetical protein
MKREPRGVLKKRRRCGIPPAFKVTGFCRDDN